MNWYTADLHLNHDAVIRFCKRPFSSVTAMDNQICEGIVSLVAADDDLWIVGDFAFARMEDRPKIVARFSALPGRKHLIVGNHDRSWVRELAWTSRQDIAVVRDGDTTFVLCHYPMLTWPQARYGSIHLFGHVHNNWLGSRNAVNVGVDVWNFAPTNRIDILRRATAQPINAHWSDVEPGSYLE